MDPVALTNKLAAKFPVKVYLFDYVFHYRCNNGIGDWVSFEKSNRLNLILVDGKWGEWSNYGDCDRTCGTGEKVRIRKCDNPAPANRGSDCIGSESEKTSCSTNPCPGTNICNLIFILKNCYIHIYTNITEIYLRIIYISARPCEWSRWVVGECSAECGAGKRNKTRRKIVEEDNGGSCPGEPAKIEVCKDKECPGN